MTNEQIIFEQSLKLMEDGILGTTGRELEFEMEDGTTKFLPEPEPIHTFKVWKELGFCVKRGEKAIASFQIWKHYPACKKIDKNTGDMIDVAEKMFLTNAFFSRSLRFSLFFLKHRV